jgi:hypothetical protein
MMPPETSGWLAALSDRIRAQLSGGSPIDTRPDSAYPRLRLGDLDCGPPPPEAVERLSRNGRVFLPVGTYEFELQSFCLEAGKHGPGSGSAYMVAPLRGRLSGLIRRLLRAAAAAPQVDQQGVQTLLWGITGRTSYHGWSPDMRRTAEELLDERDVFVLGKSHWRLVPEPVRQLISRLLRAVVEQLPIWGRAERITAGWRRVLADARMTYDDIERAFLRPGQPPGAGRSDFGAGHWSLVPGGCFVRLFPHSYQTTRAQVHVPAPAAFIIERDGRGRVTRLSVDEGPDAVFEYDDRPPAGSLDLGDGRSLPVWGFRRVCLKATQANGGNDVVAEAMDSGWVARDVRQLAALDPRRYPKLAQRIEAAQALAHDTAQLARFAGGRTQDAPAGKEAVGGQQGHSGSGVHDPLRDITDLRHYQDGLEAVMKDLQSFPSNREKMKWLKDHFGRLRRAYEYAASMLASLPANWQQGPSGGSRGQASQPPAEGSPGGWFDPGGWVGLPDDSRKQALGFRG